MFDNTVGTLQDVPVVLLGYYKEEVRSEPTGNMVEEEYTYEDMDGETQTGSRLIPEMEDITYIVQIPFGETKSWNDVSNVVNMGKNDIVIKKFISLAINGDHKDFHNDYVQWLSDEPQEPVRARNEDGTYVSDNPETDENEAYVYGYTQDMYTDDVVAWVTNKPKLKTTTEEQYLLDNYSILRQGAYGTWEKQMEMQFDGTWEAHVLAVKQRYPKEEIK